MTLRMTARAAVRVSDPKPKQAITRRCFSQSRRAPLPTQARTLILVIEEKREMVSLFRYSTDGRCLGSTWHRTVDGARQQAGLEFGDSFLDWVLVPSDVDDFVSFGLNSKDNQS